MKRRYMSRYKNATLTVADKPDEDREVEIEARDTQGHTAVTVYLNEHQVLDLLLRLQRLVFTPPAVPLWEDVE